MPRGQYERPSTRGEYKKINGKLIKKSLYLTNDQYNRIKDIADKNNITYSELIRVILNGFLLGKSIDIKK